MHVRLSFCSLIFSKNVDPINFTLGVCITEGPRKCVNSWDLWDMFISSVLQLLKVHIVVYWEGTPPPPNQLLPKKTAGYSLFSVSRYSTFKNRWRNKMSLSEWTLLTFDPGNSLVPNSQQWPVTTGSWWSHVSALHGPKSSPGPALVRSVQTLPSPIGLAPIKKLIWHKQKNSW